MTVPGGRINGVIVTAHGMPRLPVGEEFVLFMSDHKILDRTIFGGPRGVLKVTADEETGKRYVQPVSMAGAAGFLDVQKAIYEKKVAEAKQQGKSAPEPGPVLLEDFAEYVREADRRGFQKQDVPEDAPTFKIVPKSSE